MADNSFLRTLKILARLVDGPATTPELCQLFEVSPRHLSRHLDEARNLGAVIESRRSDQYVWVCTNAEAINGRGLLARWIELEERREV